MFLQPPSRTNNEALNLIEDIKLRLLVDSSLVLLTIYTINHGCTNKLQITFFLRTGSILKILILTYAFISLFFFLNNLDL